ncbi:leucine efflux protein LeuE [Neisseria leonii]|uniref:Leucine efflux protein LeuE n=1 Tax=Neisseria leonii TaxID=2995413 RepID=A0A9X4E286_9NEIS|nr:leucine efflux protein LeuE [Neisseria sp. 51.81]MDD9327379.1 leucine efflux protein LeuE [Neisseria sp. 51.81]
MFGITDFATYIIGVFAIILLPGPNSMYCLTVAGRYGTQAAYRAVAAVLLGDSLLMLAAALGAGTVLKLYPALFQAVQLVGGLYLAYLGWNLLRHAVKKWHMPPPATAGGEDGTPGGGGGIFRRALLLSLMNPKAILFFLSFFIQFVDPAYPYPGLSFLILAAVLQLVSFGYLTVLVFAGRRLTRTFRRRTKTAATGMAAVGLLFIGFAVKMWTG